MNAVFVYMTAKDVAEARAIGRALVEAGLAACINVLPGMQSIFRWEGDVQDATETVLIAKTRQELVPALTEKVRSLHSYSCPCVVSLPISGGNADYLDWLAAETQIER